MMAASSTNGPTNDPADSRSRRVRARNRALLLVLLGLVALFYALTIVRMSGS